MQRVQEVYETVRELSSAEQLRLVARILNDLSRAEEKQSARMAKAAARARDLEIINQNADRLNREALDALSDQVEL